MEKIDITHSTSNLVNNKKCCRIRRATCTSADTDVCGRRPGLPRLSHAAISLFGTPVYVCFSWKHARRYAKMIGGMREFHILVSGVASQRMRRAATSLAFRQPQHNPSVFGNSKFNAMNNPFQTAETSCSKPLGGPMFNRRRRYLVKFQSSS